MNAIRVQTILSEDGNIKLSKLPFKRGQTIEAILFLSESYTILHLDDNPIYLNLTKSLFENKKNISHIGVYTINEAFKYLKMKKTDLLITGLLFGDEDPSPAIRFIKQVNEEYPEIPVIINSAYRSQEIKKELSDYVVDNLQKGCDPNIFINKVLQYLKQ